MQLEEELSSLTGRKFSGIFNSSYDGVGVDILKSWLQKAIRRGLVEEALYAGLRLFSFQYSKEGKAKWPGRAIYSNLLNRLIVISAEDIGIGALGALDLIEQYVSFLREEEPIEFLEDRREKFISLIAFLCTQPKSRLVSRSKVFASDIPALKDNIPEFKEWIEEVEKLDNPVERVLYVLKNKERGENFSFLAVRYAVKLFECKEKEKIARVSRDGKERKILSPLVYKLWNVYLESGDKEVELLYHWYQGENEPLLYLILATLIFIVPDKVNKDFILGDPLNSQELYEQAFSEKKDPPSWAIDKHTKEGKRRMRKEASNIEEAKRRENQQFALEGAYIENVWPYSPPLLEEIYFASKGISKEDYDFTFSQLILEGAPLGQKVTSKNKRPVYILEDYVYKGPWEDNEKNRLKFSKLRERVEALEKLETKIVKAQFGKDEEGKLWLRFPNIACKSMEEWEVEEKEDKILEKPIKVVDKGSMGLCELQNLTSEDIREILFGEPFLYLSYLNCALLGVGDRCLRNHLVREDGESYLIDYEENSGREKIEEFHDVFSGSSKKLQAVVALGVEKRKEDIQEYIRKLGERKDINYPKKNWEMLASLLEK